MKYKSVSIITPAYNCTNTFKKTYESVLAQDFLDWEWIIVEDCSKDDSFSYIKEMTKNDNRITLLQMKNNSGSAAARNLGLMHASGRYITFLDSDDSIDSNYLSNQLEFIKNHGPLISSGYRRKAKHSCTNFYVPKVVDYKTALKGNPLSCLTTMYDRTVIGDVFFPEKLAKAEDYVFWLNILKRGFVAYGNNNVLATYNIIDGSKSSNKLGLIKYMFYIFHTTQRINFFKSIFCVLRWAFYGIKKYRNVR